MSSSPLTMAICSSRVSTAIFLSIVACAMEPRMSCRHNRQSNEMDSVKRATSAPGAPRNRPLRETGKFVFILPLALNLRRMTRKVTRERAIRDRGRDAGFGWGEGQGEGSSEILQSGLDREVVPSCGAPRSTQVLTACAGWAALLFSRHETNFPFPSGRGLSGLSWLGPGQRRSRRRRTRSGGGALQTVEL